jgi:hypothetical protein
LKRIRTLSLPILMAALPLFAWAHGGEDHGSEDHGSAVMPAPSFATAPRAVAQSEDFELVAVLEAKHLVLTLDRFASNEPVSNAQIELESGAVKMSATQVAPGAYSVPADAFAGPGKYALAITVQAGELSDLLTTALEVPAPAVATGQETTGYPELVWGGSGVLLVVGAALVAVRRRRNYDNPAVKGTLQ